MAGILFHDLVFGPVNSRRLGVSLGINLLPVDFKYCSFDCVYCECGWSNPHEVKNIKFPSRRDIGEALKNKLLNMKEIHHRPDAITFAGNGEPTLHPDFPEIVDDTLALRDEFFPEASVTVLSNSSTLHKKKVFNALNKTDKNILKLDAGTNKTFRLINRPRGQLTIDKIVDQLKAFNGRVIIQTLFVRGMVHSNYVDNTTDEEVNAWIQCLKVINPSYVMIYPIDRETPIQQIEKVPFEELVEIARKVEQAGFRVKVYG